MIDQQNYLTEMLEGFRRAISVMRREYPDVEIYTLSIWTDAKARKSAVSFDTLENSDRKCREANLFRKKMRDQFQSEGNLKRLALVPADKHRNDNPADFKFRNVVLVENQSLAHAGFSEAQDWPTLEILLLEIQERAAKEAKSLKLHPDAELGVNGPKTWYHRAIKLSPST